MNDVVSLTDYIIEKISGSNDVRIQNWLNQIIKSNTDLVEVVNTLPTADIEEKLYLIPNESGESPNKYDVYMYVGEDWEKIDNLDIEVNENHTHSYKDINFLTEKGIKIIDVDNYGNIDLFDGSIVYDFEDDDIYDRFGNEFAKKNELFSKNYNDLLNKPTTFSASSIIDSSSHSNINSVINDTQASINSKIDTALSGKANSVHVHGMNDINNLQSNLDNKANSVHTHSVSDVTDFPSIPSRTSDLVNDGSEGSDVYVESGDLSNVATSGSYTDLNNIPSTFLPSFHNHSIADITALNSALIGLDARLDNLESIDAIKIVANLPTASEDTMGKLYIISESSKINVYYTEQDGNNYSWHKMDADILDELVVNWSGVQGRPTKTSDFINDGEDGTNVFVSNNDGRLSNARTPTSHSHGNITNEGILPNSPNKVVVTNSVGEITSSSSVPVASFVDSSAHSNLNTSVDANQGTINTAIDNVIGTINTALSNKASKTVATNMVDGLMSYSDKVKLDSMNTVAFTIEYTDGTSETINIYKQNSS